MEELMSILKGLINEIKSLNLELPILFYYCPDNDDWYEEDEIMDDINQCLEVLQDYYSK
nr:MAG TPA: hypothetical protein [Caudoviricetes sp.]